MPNDGSEVRRVSSPTRHPISLPLRRRSSVAATATCLPRETRGPLSPHPPFPIPHSLFRRRSEAGQIHILFVFGALVMACVAFLVFNTGELSARRIRLQNGADASAHAAATWTARGLNVVSANNVATTQLIAMVVLIDSLDVYCDLAPDVAATQVSACERLKWANWPALAFDAHRWHQRAIREEEFLQGSQELPGLGDIVDEMVARWHPADPGHQDSLWQLMYMLEAFSESVIEVTPGMAAERAVAMGRNHGGEGAFAWSNGHRYWTPLPLRRGDWDDFKLPTEVGTRCPGPVRPQFGYQMMYGGTYQHNRDAEGVWHAWNIGPLRHLRRTVSNMLMAAGGLHPHARDRFGGHSNAAWLGVPFSTIVDRKFALLFSDDRDTDFRFSRQSSAYPPPPQTQQAVWWEMDMHSLQPMPNFIVQPNSFPDHINVPENYLPTPPPTWCLGTLRDPAFWRVGRGAAPAPSIDPQGFPYQPMTDGGALRTWEGFGPIQMDFMPELGIGEYGPNFARILGPLTTIYHHYRAIYSHSTWQDALTFSNPVYQRDDLPRPFLLDDTWADMSEAKMADEYSWLGFAWRSGQSRVWPRWFINSVPGGEMVAVARARLYNPTSWDMFTQDWRVQMIPVGDMPEWLNGTPGPLPGQLAGLVSDQDVEPVARFFRSVPPDLHDELMTH